MRDQYTEDEENPLQLGVRLMWDNMRDAAADAVLSTRSVHAEVASTSVESDAATTLYQPSSSSNLLQKQLTFRKPK